MRVAEQHRNLPPEDTAKFALAFKEISETLIELQDQKLKRKEKLPP
jgi:hypothetical protein